MILPRHIGEAQWLIWDSSPGDKLLVSANRSGFTSVIVRNGEPVLIRNHQCEPAAMTDELHRFALYYRDRLAGGAASALTRMLVLGDIDAIEAREAIYEATDTAPHVIEPADARFGEHDLQARESSQKTGKDQMGNNLCRCYSRRGGHRRMGLARRIAAPFAHRRAGPHDSPGASPASSRRRRSPAGRVRRARRIRRDPTRPGCAVLVAL